MRFIYYLSLLFATQVFALPEGEFSVLGHKPRLPTLTEAYYQNTPGFGFYEFLGQGSFITSDGLYLDKAKFKTNLLKFGTDSYGKGNATGSVILDWEAGPYHKMRECLPASDCYIKAEAQFLETLAFAKSIQPKMKFAFYAIPFRFWYAKQNVAWNQPGKFNNLLSKVDFITASIYQLFPEGYQHDIDRARVLQYFKENMDVALDYGVRYSKPVYMYMWQRISNRGLTSDYQMRLLRKEKFASDVKYIRSYVAPNGGKARGIYIWEAIAASNGGGSEEYIIGNRGIEDHLVNTMNSIGYDAVMREYNKSMKAAIDSVTTTTTTAPTVKITTPTSGQNFTAPATVNVEAIPTVASGVSVNRVEFFKDSSTTPFITEKIAPYTATLSSLPAGSYSVKAKIYDSKGASSVSSAVTFTVGSSTSTVQTVVAFELVNADTNQKIRNIVNGESISLAGLPTKNFSIRAVTSPLKVGSVKFLVDSTTTKTESIAPYSLNGDDSRLYPIPWRPTVKSYTLLATPYSASSGGGTKGQTLSIGFKIVN